MNTSQIDTPAVVIDIDVAQRNIEAFQKYCDQHGLALRPHIKTHKLPRFAKAQIDAGAVGINCQKIGEAEVMADAGIDNILITYNILGAAKLKRLRALHERIKVAVTADSTVVIEGLSWAFANALKPLAIFVECDTGAKRCGAQSPQDAVELARRISASQGLEFAGLMTYPAKGGTAVVQSFMTETKARLSKAGLPCHCITSGGTPDGWQAHLAPVATEYRTGTYIYNDRSLVEGGCCALTDCALTVLTTVVSTPTADRAIIDAGSKILTSDLIGLSGYGAVVDHPRLVVSGLSEEHGHLDCSAAPGRLNVGDRIRIVPNHACVVSNMVDAVHLVQGSSVVAVEPVAARGKIN